MWNPFRPKPPARPLYVSSPEVVSMLKGLNNAVAALTRKVNQMALDYSALNASLTSETNAVAAMGKAFDALQAELKALAGQITDPTAQQQINDFAAKWQAQNDAMTAAIVANTPAAPAKA